MNEFGPDTGTVQIHAPLVDGDLHTEALNRKMKTYLGDAVASKMESDLLLKKRIRKCHFTWTSGTSLKLFASVSI